MIDALAYAVDFADEGLACLDHHNESISTLLLSVIYDEVE